MNEKNYNDLPVSVDFTTIVTITKEEYAQLKSDGLELQIIKSGNSVSYKRHVFKAVTYRALGSMQTCLISYFFTGDFWVAGSIGLTEMCIKPIVYFLHERAWYNFSQYGIKNKRN